MTNAMIDQAMQTAFEHHWSGRSAEAETICRQILAQEPDAAHALRLLGLIATQSGQPEVAVLLLKRAISAQPGVAEFHDELGAAFALAGRLSEAVAAHRAAISLAPNEARFHYNAGNALSAAGRAEEAVASYRRALQLQPTLAPAWINLGITLQKQGESAEAITCYSQATKHQPTSFRAWSNLGDALQAAGRLDEAVTACEKALQVKSDFSNAHHNLGNCLRSQGRLGAAMESYRRAVELEPTSAQFQSSLIYTACFQPGYSAKELLELGREWNRRFAFLRRDQIPDYENDPAPNRRLKIGYFSPDFRHHVVGYNLLPLFREHDRNDFEIFAYAEIGRPDAMTNEFAGLSDHWRNLNGVADEQAAAMIAADGIDIFVDLALHMPHNRLPLFSRKPAPVQVTFGGYPGGTGLEAMDYRLTDPYLDPPGQTDGDYEETSMRLPHSFWCYDPTAMAFGLDAPPQAGASVALEKGYVTFGCLGNFWKINEAVLRLWAKVLRATPRSRLVFLSPEGSHRESVLDLLRRERVEADRIEMKAYLPRAAYFAEYHHIDVVLDTFPYTGHTTNLDALWMGVPVVTLLGDTVVGRAGLSHLHNLGLTEWAASTPEEFVYAAMTLAADHQRLAELRQELPERMRASPLTDAKAFTRGVEAAFREMWCEWGEKSRAGR